ncbi:hypothetical protein FQN50_004627 [Emmonsiellopsis sp. PD_5]|nr:hypothetical protein FQN50_004627 [Emmonsiellopsis sp. PD_5]
MNKSWIGDRFHNLSLAFPDGTWWAVDDKICEKTFLDEEGHERKDGITVMEAQATYHCHQAEGPEKGLEGIMKIKMQIPPGYALDLSYEERCSMALQGFSKISMMELSSLQWLSDQGCSSSPKLLAYFQVAQPSDMVIPGGYITILVMEKLPGSTLDDFWECPFEQREKIRAAFKRALIEVYGHGVVHCDRRLPNIQYDEKNDKCYILDYEQSRIHESKENFPRWRDWEWATWGLTKDGFEGQEIY